MSNLDEGLVTKVNVIRLTTSIIVFTLLLLFKTVPIPEFSDPENFEFFSTYIAKAIPGTINFINAFLIVAILWILIFHVFNHIQRVNRRFLFFHFGLLMTIVFIPYTSFLADAFVDISISSLILHFNILLCALLILLEFSYSIRQKNLILPIVTIDEITKTNRRITTLIVASVIGIVLCAFDINGTRFLYIAVIVVFLADSILKDHIYQKRYGKNKTQDRLLYPDDNLQKNQELNRAKTTGQITATSFRGPIGLDMLERVVNGTFGFSMTLILKNIPIPTSADIHNIKVLFQFIIRFLSDAIDSVFVFIVLILLWLLTFQMIRWMQTVDLTFVFLELFVLMMVVFIPITSLLMSHFSSFTLMNGIFGANIIICDSLLIIQWYYLRSRTNLMQRHALSKPFMFLKKQILIVTGAALLWSGLSVFDIGIPIFPLIIGICAFLLVSRELQTAGEA